MIKTKHFPYGFYYFVNSSLKLLALFFPLFLFTGIIFTGNFKYFMNNKDIFSFAPFLSFFITLFFLFNYNFWYGFFYKKTGIERQIEHLKRKRVSELTMMKYDIEMEKKHYEFEIERLRIKRQFIERKKELEGDQS